MPWRGPRFDGEFPSLGPQIVEHIEHYLCHGPGDVIGQPIELDDEFYEFIVRAYRIEPETGRRIYRRAFLSRAKGRAKSELAGMITCAEALFPVRFAGWDADGEPVGRPVQSPFIRCLATEENQSGNTFDNVATMLTHVVDTFGDEFPGIDVGRSAQSSTRILLRAQQGEIVPSTASSSSKDGGKETFAVFDETHVYTLPELHRMHDVVRRNLRKRRAAEPWALETSTMYRPGEESVAEKTHEYAKAIAEGRRRETGLLFDHREASADTDLADRESLLAGLREAYGPAAAWMDLDGIIAEIWDPQSDPSDSRRYWLNQVTSSSDAWLAAHEWDQRATPEKEIVDGDVITLGFDGSIREDATGLVACRVDDGHLEALLVDEKPEGPEGKDWQVNRPRVHAAIATAMQRYRVVGLYADPPHWQDAVDTWTDLYGKRMLVKATQPRPLEWWTQRPTPMVAALERFHEATLSAQLSHRGQADELGSALRRHVLNARRRVAPQGVLISKEHPQSPRKIDLAMAAVLAYEARADAVARGFGRLRKRAGKARAHGF